MGDLVLVASLVDRLPNLGGNGKAYTQTGSLGGSAVVNICQQGSCLEKAIMQGTMPGARRRGRPRTAWMDNIKTWAGLSVEESVRMTEDRDKWRKYVHGVANAQIEDG